MSYGPHLGSGAEQGPEMVACVEQQTVLGLDRGTNMSQEKSIMKCVLEMPLGKSGVTGLLGTSPSLGMS